MELIELKRKTRAVLVYADDPIYKELLQTDFIKTVPEELDESLLSTLNWPLKDTGLYPVYLINSKYGGRGVNYRAPDHTHGITMIIGGAFPDERTRIQTLLRVGRFGDNCERIQDELVQDIDIQVNGDRMGKIMKAGEKVTAKFA